MRIQRNNPVKNTVAQQDTATKNRSPLNHAARSPTTSAAIPDQMLSVAHSDTVYCQAHDQKRRINSRIHIDLLIQ